MAFSFGGAFLFPSEAHEEQGEKTRHRLNRPLPPHKNQNRRLRPARGGAWRQPARAGVRRGGSGGTGRRRRPVWRRRRRRLFVWRCGGGGARVWRARCCCCCPCRRPRVWLWRSRRGDRVDDARARLWGACGRRRWTLWRGAGGDDWVWRRRRRPLRIRPPGRDAAGACARRRRRPFRGERACCTGRARAGGPGFWRIWGHDGGRRAVWGQRCAGGSGGNSRGARCRPCGRRRL